MIVIYELCFLKLSTANGYLSCVRQSVAKETPQMLTAQHDDSLLVPRELAFTINVIGFSV